MKLKKMLFLFPLLGLFFGCKTAQVSKPAVPTSPVEIREALTPKTAPQRTRGPKNRQKSSKQVVVKVKKGDTLWDISKKVYKNPFKWPLIGWENNIVNYDLIEVGDRLRISKNNSEEEIQKALEFAYNYPERQKKVRVSSISIQVLGKTQGVGTFTYNKNGQLY